jgi:hypothetical protein
MTDDVRKRILARINPGPWPTCKVCSSTILLGRLESLPDTDVCAKHSQEKAYIGVPNYAHKTAATIAMVKPDPEADDGLGESVRILMDTYRRKR